FGQIDRVPDFLFRFVHEADHEVAPDLDPAHTVDQRCSLSDLLDSDFLLYQLLYALVARLDSNSQGFAAGLLHELKEFRSERVETHAYRAIPPEVQSCLDQTLAKLRGIASIERKFIVDDAEAVNVVPILQEPKLLDHVRDAAMPKLLSRETGRVAIRAGVRTPARSEEHTSELQSPDHLVCR